MDRAAGKAEWNMQIIVNPTLVRDVMGNPVSVLLTVAVNRNMMEIVWAALQQ